MFAVNTHLPTGHWTLDPSRTTVSFDVRNGRRLVRGTVPATQGGVRHDAAGVRVDAVLDLSAVDTGNARRDRDLRKPYLLHLDRHPTMQFSASTLAQEDGGLVVSGTLSVRGRELPLALTVTEPITDAGGGELVAEGTAQVDRRDVGIVAPPFLIGRRIDIAVRAVLIPG